MNFFAIIGVVVVVLFIVGYLRFRASDDMEHTYA